MDICIMQTANRLLCFNRWVVFFKLSVELILPGNEPVQTLLQLLLLCQVFPDKKCTKHWWTSKNKSACTLLVYTCLNIRIRKDKENQLRRTCRESIWGKWAFLSLGLSTRYMQPLQLPCSYLKRVLVIRLFTASQSTGSNGMTTGEVSGSEGEQIPVLACKVSPISARALNTLNT